MTYCSIEMDNDGVRIDRWLRKKFPDLSLSMIYRCIRKKQIKVNGKAVTQEMRLHTGDTVMLIGLDAVSMEETSGVDGVPAAVIRLHGSPFYTKMYHPLFEDEDIIVCDKPQGLVVHGGTGHTRHDTLIDCVTSSIYAAAKKRDQKFDPPHLVHRLDRDTSGLILIAKNKTILRQLHEAFRNHAIVKQYVALCHGIPPRKEGQIRLNLEKVSNRNEGMKMRVAEDDGVESHSSYHVSSRGAHFSLLELTLHTGKTHQLRVHCSHIDCPIIGDERYGDRALDGPLFSDAPELKRLYLHAASIRFYHPALKREISFVAPVPPEFTGLMKRLS